MKIYQKLQPFHTFISQSMKCKHHEHVFYPIVEGQWALQLLTSRMNWPEQQLCIDFAIPHYFSANNYCHCQHAG